MMIKIRAWLVNYWEVLAQIVVGLAVITAVMFYKLSSITPGASLSEVQLHQQLVTHVFNARYLWHHIIGLPYYIFMGIFNYAHISSETAIRSVGAGFGVATVLLFYYVVKRWHGPLIAVLASAFFLVNTWFLLSTRLGKISSIYAFGGLLVLVIGFLNRRLTQRSLNLLVITVLVAALLYIPGFIWLILVGLIWQRAYIVKEIAKLPTKLKLAYSVLFLLIIAPLVSSLYLTPSQLKLFVGLPKKFIGIKHAAINFAKLPYHLFIRGNPAGNLSLGHLPIINVFITVLIILGIYDYLTKHKLDRLVLIGGIIFVGVLLAALDGPVAIFLTMPFWYILAAGGLSYLNRQWLSVFPKNPVARSVGVTLLALAVATFVFYQFNQFFIAWPHAAETIQLYSHPI